jgi:Tfp pilus assembly protein PilF
MRAPRSKRWLCRSACLLAQGVALLVALLPLAGCVSSALGIRVEKPLLPSQSASGKGSPELPPAKAAELCWAAGEEMRKGGFEAEAVTQYEKVREHDPRWPRVAWRLALLYDRQGNGVKAAAEYQRALEAEPRNADLLNDYGYFSYQRGDLANAEARLRQALTLSPKHARVSVNLGLTLGKQGRFAEALACFQRTLPPAQAHCNVGVLLANQGRTAEARSYFQEAQRLDPALAQARTFLALLDRPPGADDTRTR